MLLAPRPLQTPPRPHRLRATASLLAIASAVVGCIHETEPASATTTAAAAPVATTSPATAAPPVASEPAGNEPAAPSPALAFGAREYFSSPRAAVALDGGDFVVVGQTHGVFVDGRSADFGIGDAFAARVAPDGSIRWARQWGDPNRVELATSVQRRDDTLLVAVVVNGGARSQDLDAPGYATVMMTLNLDGSERARFVVEGMVEDVASAPDASGDLALCLREVDARGGVHFVVARVGEDGTRRWQVRNPPRERRAEPSCAAIDWRDDRIVASGSAASRVFGATQHANANGDMGASEQGALTLSIDASRGRVLWSRQWTGAQQYATDVAIGRDGGVFVSVDARYTRSSSPSRYEAVLLGYSPDGDERFVQRREVGPSQRGRDLVRAIDDGVLWLVSLPPQPIGVDLLRVDAAGAVHELGRVDTIHYAADVVAADGGLRLLGRSNLRTAGHTPARQGDPAIVPLPAS